MDFLGYSLIHKGYKCLSPTDRIFISKDVIFDETYFPSIIVYSSPPIIASTFSEFHVSSLIPTPPFSGPCVAPSNAITCDTILPNVVLQVREQVSKQAPSTSQQVLAPSPALVLPTHPMQTQSKSGMSKPKVYLTIVEPFSVAEALAHESW